MYPQLADNAFDEYSREMSTRPPVTVLESEKEQAVPPVGYSHDPSEQEGSIVEQAAAVEKQWKWIVEVLKQRLDQCNDLMKELKSFEEKYKAAIAFIEQGEQLINQPIMEDPKLIKAQVEEGKVHLCIQLVWYCQ